MDVDEEELFQGVIDSQEHVNIIKDLFKADGSKAFIMQYQEDSPPAIGREFQKIFYLKFKFNFNLQQVDAMTRN